MTKQSNYLVIDTGISGVENLVKETKETLAVNFIGGNNKTFRTVDLWNIQRQRKSRASNKTLSYAGL